MRPLHTLTKGFTIVEFLIYMGLLSIFLIVLTNVFVSIFDVKSESEATSAVQQDGRYILQRLIYDVSRASSISTPGSYGLSTTNLVLNMSGVEYTYSISGNNLQLVNNLGANKLNSSNTIVSGITFQKIGNTVENETVQIDFSLSSVADPNGGVETRSFQTTVARR